MKKWVLPLVMITSLLAPVSKAEYLVYGVGSDSCGSWLEGRAGKKDQTKYESQVHWLTGFVSGFGFSNNDLRETDISAMMVWIDNWCQENPLESLQMAAGYLVLELNENL